MALNIKGTTEELTNTVHVDFVDIPVYEDRLGFYKTYGTREQGTPIVHWILDMKASGHFSSQYMAPYTCHQSNTGGPLGAKSPATTYGRACHGRWGYDASKVELTIEQELTTHSTDMGDSHKNSTHTQTKAVELTKRSPDLLPSPQLEVHWVIGSESYSLNVPLNFVYLLLGTAQHFRIKGLLINAYAAHFTGDSKINLKKQNKAIQAKKSEYYVKIHNITTNKNR